MTIAAKEGQELAELLALLEKLPDPLTYLSTGEKNKDMIDPEQLAEAREKLDAWLAENKTEDTENKETLSGEEEERLAELIQRLEGLEHIRDTETDCMDLKCPYHYPEMIQQRMAEDELPELLTLKDLVEDYGVEPPEENAMPAAAWDTDQPRRAPAWGTDQPRRTPARASALTPHPQTLMVTEDNENNSHTGKADGDIDESMGCSNKKHPIELAFTLDELPTQSAYLAVKAYDVDEDDGETDYVYLNDDIYLPGQFPKRFLQIQRCNIPDNHFGVRMIRLIGRSYFWIILVSKDNIKPCLLKAKGQAANPCKQVNNPWSHSIATPSMRFLAIVK